MAARDDKKKTPPTSPTLPPYKWQEKPLNEYTDAAVEDVLRSMSRGHR